MKGKERGGLCVGRNAKQRLSKLRRTTSLVEQRRSEEKNQFHKKERKNERKGSKKKPQRTKPHRDPVRKKNKAPTRARPGGWAGEKAEKYTGERFRKIKTKNHQIRQRM